MIAACWEKICPVLGGDFGTQFFCHLPFVIIQMLPFNFSGQSRREKKTFPFSFGKSATQIFVKYVKDHRSYIRNLSSAA